MDMNNEMDELFRKAGEGYPLNLGQPDWDRVAGKLDTDTGDLGPGFGVPTTFPRKRRRYLWLLLLPLSAGIYDLAHLTAGSTGPAYGNGRQSVKGLRDGQQAVNKPVENSSVSRKDILDSGRENEGRRDDSAPPNGDVYPKETPGPPIPVAVAVVTGNALISYIPPDEPMAEKQPQTTGSAAAAGPGSKLPEKNVDSGESATGSRTVIHASLKRERGFYAGITAAPDLSSIKFQTMKNTGYGFTVVAGYRIDRHFSIETGIGWDRKNYYSKGRYFDKSRTKIPPAVNVTYVDGYCDMFEIPVTLRYDLKAGKRAHWVAGAGFSTYLMKNEKYLYGALTNNIAWTRNIYYKNSGNNLFSILQLSAGYEYDWKLRNRIRIEPYFKVPLSGIGIGSLPVSSVGITFGLVHSFR